MTFRRRLSSRRHGEIGTNERRVLPGARRPHRARPAEIRTTLGPRTPSAARHARPERASRARANARSSLITGPAGSGKSAMGKEAVGVLARITSCSAFGSRNSPQPHLDETLATRQVPANWATSFAPSSARRTARSSVSRASSACLKNNARRVYDLMTLAADDVACASS